MAQTVEELKLGSSLAGEFGLTPQKNSFTAAHPDAYYYGVFYACTNRPLPQRQNARKAGHAPSPHAYEVLKLGFADASNALGRPVLIHSRPDPPAQRIGKKLGDGLKDKVRLPAMRSASGKPSMAMVVLMLVGLATVMFLIQNVVLPGMRGEKPSAPAIETPMPGSEGGGKGETI